MKLSANLLGLAVILLLGACSQASGAPDATMDDDAGGDSGGGTTPDDPEGDGGSESGDQGLDAEEAERRLLELMSETRASEGLPPLEVYWDLTDDARAQSQQMASDDRVYDSPSLTAVALSENWTDLGENVGRGPSIESIYEEFLQDPGRRDRVLGEYGYAGAGVTRRDDGTYFVDVIFMQSSRSGLEDSLPPFADDELNPHEPAINAIWLEGITDGCDSRRFCPDRIVNRAHMAVFLVNSLALPTASTDYFTDDDGHWAEDEINALAAAGITNGCTAGQFCPTESLTRGQAAMFLDRSFGFPEATQDYFDDDNGSIYEDAANRLREAGVTLGCSSTGDMFCGSDYLIRAQLASFLAHSLDLLQ